MRGWLREARSKADADVSRSTRIAAGSQSSALGQNQFEKTRAANLFVRLWLELDEATRLWLWTNYRRLPQRPTYRIR